MCLSLSRSNLLLLERRSNTEGEVTCGVDTEVVEQFSAAGVRGDSGTDDTRVEGVAGVVGDGAKPKCMRGDEILQTAKRLRRCKPSLVLSEARSF